MRCCVTMVTGPAGGLDYSTEKSATVEASSLYAAVYDLLLQMPLTTERILIEGEVSKPPTAKREEKKTKKKKKR